MVAVPVAGAALMLPALAEASEPEDPILPLYREWWAARREWYRYAFLPGNGNFDRPESVAADARIDAAFYAMLETTPTTMEGIAALITVWWNLEGPMVLDGEEYRKACNEPGNKLIRAIYRAASGTDRNPPNDRSEGLA